ncbi:MAG: ribonuclease III [Fusobacteria bacterium]|nr:ribonuclease III [Fusobacteriota bacterium]
MFAQLEKIISYHFIDKNLLKHAFIHKSYGNENRGYSNVNNERLEFFGDAILDFILTEHIFDYFKEKNEGELAKIKAMLVSEPVLFTIAKKLNLGEYLYLSHGEEVTGGRERESILADSVEALLGAIYIDSKNIDEARRFILPYMIDQIKTLYFEERLTDFKTVLQEKSQELFKKTPCYVVLKEEGPAHNREFEIGVEVQGEIFGRGFGKSKKNAAQQAAKNALERLSDEKKS